MVLLLKIRVQGKWVRNDDAPPIPDAVAPPNATEPVADDLPSINNNGDITGRTESAPIALDNSDGIDNAGSDLHNSPMVDNDQETLQTATSTDNTPSNASYPNNEDTIHLFRFKNYGNKLIKDIGRRLYYKCTYKGCGAQYHTTESPNNQKPKAIVFLDPLHNHPPISNPRIRPAVKEKALSQLSAGATPSNVHANLVREAATPLSPTDVPTLSQLKKWKHVFSMKDMPSGK